MIKAYLAIGLLPGAPLGYDEANKLRNARRNFTAENSLLLLRRVEYRTRSPQKWPTSIAGKDTNNGMAASVGRAMAIGFFTDHALGAARRRYQWPTIAQRSTLWEYVSINMQIADPHVIRIGRSNPAHQGPSC